MLTVVLLTHNNATELKKLLPKLSFADKCLIIDDESSDQTRVVAQAAGVRVLRRKLNQDWAAQRNEALKRVRTKWVLFIDPDEIPDRELIESIMQVMKLSKPMEAYDIRRVTIFEGKKLLHGDVGRERLVRFGQAQRGKFVGKVHERWEVADIGSLNGCLWHYSHSNYALMKMAVLRYAKVEALSRFDRGIDWSVFEWILYPIGKLGRALFWNLGFLDGMAGIKMAWLHSVHSFMVRLYLHELYFPKRQRELLERLIVLVFWIIFGAILLGQGLRFEHLNIPIYGHELLMILYCALFAVRIAIRKEKPIIPPLLLPLMLLLLAMASSLFWQRAPLIELLEPSLYWWRLVLYGAFYTITYDAFSRGDLRIEPERLLLLATALLALGGWLQYLLFPDLRFLKWYGWDDHYFRLVGTLLDPAYLSVILAIGLVLAEKWAGKRLGLAYLFIGGALLFTYSRSAYVVYVLGIILLMTRWRAWKGLVWRLLLLLGAVSLLVTAPRMSGESVNLKRTYSIEARAESTLAAWEVFLNHPITGIGYNRYKEISQVNYDILIPYHPSGPDNSLALVLATTGAIGAVALIFLAFRAYTIYREDSMGLTLSVMYFLYGMTNNSWFYPFLLWWLAILWSKGAYSRE